MRASLPISVTTGVLPLAAKAHGVAGDIERAAFLLSTSTGAGGTPPLSA